MLISLINAEPRVQTCRPQYLCVCTWLQLVV